MKKLTWFSTQRTEQHFRENDWGIWVGLLFELWHNPHDALVFCRKVGATIGEPRQHSNIQMLAWKHYWQCVRHTTRYRPLSSLFTARNMAQLTWGPSMASWSIFLLSSTKKFLNTASFKSKAWACPMISDVRYLVFTSLSSSRKVTRISSCFFL